MHEEINRYLKKIKDETPLILNITNYVTMDFIANGLLSLGAAPIMSHAKHEFRELIASCQALVINLGTVNDEFMDLCTHACALANELAKPIILDPVGAGASHYRTQSALHLLHDYDIAIVRANASEVIALGERVATPIEQRQRGVDSLHSTQEALECAHAISIKHDAAIVISGKIDFIVDQEQVAECTVGSPLMKMVTGTGCLLSSVVASFCAVSADRFAASLAATMFYGLCGERAAQKSQNPGSFKIFFIDALHQFVDAHAQNKLSSYA